MEQRTALVRGIPGLGSANCLNEILWMDSTDAWTRTTCTCTLISNTMLHTRTSATQDFKKLLQT